MLRLQTIPRGPLAYASGFYRLGQGLAPRRLRCRLHLARWREDKTRPRLVNPANDKFFNKIKGPGSMHGRATIQLSGQRGRPGSRVGRSSVDGFHSPGDVTFLAPGSPDPARVTPPTPDASLGSQATALRGYGAARLRRCEATALRGYDAARLRCCEATMLRGELPSCTRRRRKRLTSPPWSGIVQRDTGLIVRS